MSHNIDKIERLARGTFREHQMTAIREDGEYRHLRFARADRGLHSFDMHTAPGLLTVVGDIGGPWSMRARVDMLDLVRGSNGSGINPHYWGEKLQGGRDSVLVYSSEVFRQKLLDVLAEADEDTIDVVSDAVVPALKAIARVECETALDAEHYVRAGEKAGAWSDSWEWDLRDWSTDWLWGCHAILAGVRLYDAAKATTEDTTNGGGSGA